MRTGISITVSRSDRQRLDAIIRDRTAPQKHVWRARIVLLTADGLGTSLDELPQFFNVIKGEMSVVGPRPHATRAKAGGNLSQDVVIEYAARHNVRPGIKGWAQVCGWRGETGTEEKIKKRVEHDIYYIENWSFSLNMWILLKVLMVVFRGKK